MILGAHLSIAGGLEKSVDRAKAIGCNALQIFSSPPQQWSPPIFTPESCTQFKKYAQAEGISTVFVHGTYLINLASDKSFLVHQSKQSLIEDLRFCGMCGIRGVIFHFGSHASGWQGKKDTLIPIIHDILDKTPPETEFIIENSAGTGSKIGGTLEELATMKQEINNSRIHFCLDTAHAFAAGYDLRTKDTVDVFANQVEKTIGWKAVSAIHLNDSKIDFGKKNDRHENIGEGFIGKEGLSEFIHHPLITNIPFILETPGFDGEGPDLENIEIVKSL